MRAARQRLVPIRKFDSLTFPTWRRHKWENWLNHNGHNMASKKSVCQKVIGSSHTGTSKQSLAIEMQKPLHNAPFINHFSYSHFYELIRYNLLLVVPSKTLLLLVVPKIHEWPQAYLPAPIVGLNINCFHEPPMATEFLPSNVLAGSNCGT